MGETDLSGICIVHKYWQASFQVFRVIEKAKICVIRGAFLSVGLVKWVAQEENQP